MGLSMKRLAVALAGLAFGALLAPIVTDVLAQDRVPGGAIRDRIRDRMELRRGDQVAPLGSASKVPGGGPGYESILIKGQVRTFMRYTPNSVLVAAKRAPVVFALHGAKGTAAKLQGYLGLNQVADREGFIVVYPQGDNNRWNDGREASAKANNETSTADDAGFLNALADSLVAQGVADRDRLYLMGLSNGGFMTLTLACSQESRFAAYGAVIASMSDGIKNTCKPSRAAPVVMINGTDDQLIRFDGGAGKFGIAGNAPPSDVAKHFGTLAGCTGSADTALPDIDSNDGTTVTKTTWTGCKSAGVEFYTVKGGGHQAPVTGKTAGSVVLDMFLGTRSHDIDAAEAVWSFMRRFQR
jgi:polyhydroxybutyrate depolymerase